MSSGIAGIAFGMLATAALDAVVANPAAAGRVGLLGDVTAAAFNRLVSPSVPAIPVRGANTHPYQQLAGQAPTAAGGAGAKARVSMAALRTRPVAPKAPSKTTTTVSI